MIRPTATTETGRRCRLQAISLVLVCALGGAVNFFNVPFATWVVRIASFPEEEEVHAKDRSALVAAVQPSRRGSIRPKSLPGERVTRVPSHLTTTHTTSLTPVTHRILTGAGIYQRC